MSEKEMGHSSVPIASEGEGKHLKRDLGSRHIQLLAIGGAIGTGLFMGAGKTIHLAGPSIILVYAIIGFFLFFVMRAMGEILISNLHYKSFRDFSADLLGPWAGFFTGWTYWLCWIVTCTANVVAVASYVQYWMPHLTDEMLWIPALICVVILFLLNLCAVGLFGELEFWFSMIKIVAICALIVTGLGLALYGFTSPAGQHAAISNLWSHGGFFPQGARGFLAGFQIAIYAFVGVELIGITAAEVKHPEQNLPRAINATMFKIVCCYVLALVAIMVVTPWNVIAPDKSPFVEMFMLVGIMTAASVVNFVVLTSAASSANSGFFSTGRMLYGLALEQQAPGLFGRLSARQVPVVGMIFSCLCLLAAVALIYAIPDVMAVFTLVTTVSVVLFLFIWGIILYSYIVFRRRTAPEDRPATCRMPGGLGMAWASLLFFVCIVGVLFIEPDTRKGLIIIPIWFIILALAYKFNTKNKSL